MKYLVSKASKQRRHPNSVGLRTRPPWVELCLDLTNFPKTRHPGVAQDLDVPPWRAPHCVSCSTASSRGPAGVDMGAGHVVQDPALTLSVGKLGCPLSVLHPEEERPLGRLP